MINNQSDIKIGDILYYPSTKKFGILKNILLIKNSQNDKKICCKLVLETLDSTITAPSDTFEVVPENIQEVVRINFMNSNLTEMAI